MENNVKNRGWVKNAAIVFLLVLLILTFFSNTIMNRSLPEVATQRIDSGTITAKVRGTGKVESDGLYEVKTTQTREIRSVLVKAGQEVEAGDILFLLGEGTSEEVEAATEKLRSLQLSYEKAKVSGYYSDYTILEYQVEKAQQELEDAKAVEAEALEQLNAQYEQLNTQIKALNAKYEYWEEQEDLWAKEYNSEMERLQREVELAQEALNVLEPDDPKYSEAQAALETAISKQNDYMSSTDPDSAYNKMVKAQEQKNATAEELSKLSGNYDYAYNQAVENRVAKEDALISAQSSLRTQQISDGRSNAALALELKDLKEQIEIAKEKLAKLTGEDDNTITAKVAGTIASVNYTAGNTPAKDSVLCTIDVPDMGYTLSFSCTSDQARRLHVGDTASVSNYYWGSTITATLTSIQTDPKNPQTSKVLTFDVEGDVSSGAELTISVGSKSATYDLIIPNNAIRKDTNGTYVLVIESKNSALGNRYFAKRVTVEVIAEDDLNSAVTGNLNTGDFVLTTSSVPVKSGEQVRIKES